MGRQGVLLGADTQRLPVQPILEIIPRPPTAPKPSTAPHSHTFPVYTGILPASAVPPRISGQARQGSWALVSSAVLARDPNALKEIRPNLESALARSGTIYESAFSSESVNQIADNRASQAEKGRSMSTMQDPGAGSSEARYSAVKSLLSQESAPLLTSDDDTSSDLPPDPALAEKENIRRLCESRYIMPNLLESKLRREALLEREKRHPDGLHTRILYANYINTPIRRPKRGSVPTLALEDKNSKEESVKKNDGKKRRQYKKLQLGPMRFANKPKESGPVHDPSPSISDRSFDSTGDVSGAVPGSKASHAGIGRRSNAPKSLKSNVNLIRLSLKMRRAPGSTLQESTSTQEPIAEERQRRTGSRPVSSKIMRPPFVAAATEEAGRSSRSGSARTSILAHDIRQRIRNSSFKSSMSASSSYNGANGAAVAPRHRAGSSMADTITLAMLTKRVSSAEGTRKRRRNAVKGHAADTEMRKYQLEEVDRIVEAFHRQGMSISRRVVERAILVPEEILHAAPKAVKVVKAKPKRIPMHLRQRVMESSDSDSDEADRYPTKVHEPLSLNSIVVRPRLRKVDSESRLVTNRGRTNNWWTVDEYKVLKKGWEKLTEEHRRERVNRAFRRKYMIMPFNSYIRSRPSTADAAVRGSKYKRPAADSLDSLAHKPQDRKDYGRSIHKLIHGRMQDGQGNWFPSLTRGRPLPQITTENRASSPGGGGDARSIFRSASAATAPRSQCSSGGGRYSKLPDVQVYGQDPALNADLLVGEHTRRSTSASSMYTQSAFSKYRPNVLAPTPVPPDD
ncbi:uncharacterized protein BJ171DRAFT_488647 [Polychytrium aggregatum]|uniref:uncharacterized protein n=1 Tax=Polychytrium aggregatum TaxID=110093 RepID=UPI0022FDDC13|nr:uncharacterized protein BJ171DRAFT_488647 [Polychytrium aggregatum]KAI9209151.1 hypothetical protein BJ171DRAFT_488647 [Polychytrium aggregatum]